MFSIKSYTVCLYVNWATRLGRDIIGVRSGIDLSTVRSVVDRTIDSATGGSGLNWDFVLDNSSDKSDL